jgi:hypothetical protein
MSAPECSGRPADFVTTYRCDLNFNTGGARTLVGVAELSVVNLVGARAFGLSPFDILADEERWGAYLELYDLKRPGCYIPAVERQRSSGLPGTLGNLLIFERVEILPAHRGQDMALRYHQTALQLFRSGCDFAVLMPFPLQYEWLADPDARREWRAAMELSQFPRDQRGGTMKLKRHYQRSGFEPLRGSALMLVNFAAWRPSAAPRENLTLNTAT